MYALVHLGLKRVCRRCLVELFTMGSAPEGTLRVLRQRHFASYIPEHIPGLICFSPYDEDVQAGRADDYEGCFDRAQRVGWNVVFTDYYLMCWHAKIMALSKKAASNDNVLAELNEELQVRIATFVCEEVDVEL